MRIAVITAITNNKDVLREDQNFHGAEFYAFTDQKSDNWICRPPINTFEDPVRNAKIYKVMPHKFIDCDYSVWIDGNISIRKSAKFLINNLLGNGDMWAMTHFCNKCVYAEGFSVFALQFDDMDTIIQHIERYHDEGYPKDNGLYECNVLIRKHTEKVNRLNEMWWNEICKGSRRDQISFPYVLHKNPIDIRTSIGNVRKHNWFNYINHNYVYGDK